MRLASASSHRPRSIVMFCLACSVLMHCSASGSPSVSMSLAQPPASRDRRGCASDAVARSAHRISLAGSIPRACSSAPRRALCKVRGRPEFARRSDSAGTTALSDFPENCKVIRQISCRAGVHADASIRFDNAVVLVFLDEAVGRGNRVLQLQLQSLQFSSGRSENLCAQLSRPACHKPPQSAPAAFSLGNSWCRSTACL